MIIRSLGSPPEEWPNDRADLISVLRSKDEDEAEVILEFIEEHTTNEMPDYILRFILALADAEPDIISNGTLNGFLENMEELGPGIYELWCRKEEFDATARLVRYAISGLEYPVS